MTKSDKDTWMTQHGCITCLQEIMKGFLDRKEKTLQEVEHLMAKVPVMWEPMNDPEDSRRAAGTQQCPKHGNEVFQFDRYLNH